MPRDPLTRMDVDTGWPYHRKVRRLQHAEPDRWPLYWAAYMALLAEAWRIGDRSLTLADAWCHAIPCTVTEAAAALRAVGILDRHDRVPVASWNEWYVPVANRYARLRDAGRSGGQATQRTIAQAKVQASLKPLQPASQPASQPAKSRARARLAGSLTPLAELLAPPPGYVKAKP